MFDNLFKKKKSTETILTWSWKKTNFFDIFKIDAFILISFLILIAITIFLFIESTKNSILIKKDEESLTTDYQRLIEYSNTLGFLNGLKVQKFDGNKVIKILNYLESLDLFSYNLEFNSQKQYFFVNLKNINNQRLEDIVNKWLESWTLNYIRTNQTIKITEEGKVSITLIFN